MPRVPGFIHGSAISQSVVASNELTMNLYLEKIGTAGVGNKMALYPVPGQAVFVPTSQITSVGVRASLEVNGQAFVVVGPDLWEIFSDGTATKRSTLVMAQDNNLAQIAYNGRGGNQLLISSGGNGYLYNLGTLAFTQVLTGTATQIGMLNTRFLAINTLTGQLQLSALNDGATWSGVLTAVRTAQPDPWVAMIIDAPDIYLFGSKSTDVWYDAGASPFPLVPRTGLLIPYGVTGIFTPAVRNHDIFWQAANKDGAGTVVRASGYAATPISTPEVDTAIGRFRRESIITDAESLLYEQDGHVFYCVTWPSVPATKCYDITTDSWTDRGKWNPPQARFDAWTPRVHLDAFGKHLVGTRTSGSINSLELSLAVEDSGEGIRRVRRGPVLIDENKPIDITRFELLVENGVGLQLGQGFDPTVMFRQSGDGGRTWSNERTSSIGKAGQFQARCFWLQCGFSRLWVPEVSFSDPIPLRIVDAFLNNVEA